MSFNCVLKCYVKITCRHKCNCSILGRRSREKITHEVIFASPLRMRLFGVPSMPQKLSNVSGKPSDDSYGEQETAQRRDAAIKRMLATPPEPHSEMKIGKSRRKAEKSPKGRPSG
jgi:hypothetical protein